MPRPRFLRLDAARRNRLLEAAAREFAARGYDRASLNRVIETEGLSKGQFYYYFDDKADLFVAVLEWAWPFLVPYSREDFQALTAETFWPTLDRWVVGWRDRAHAMPWLIGLSRLIYAPPSEPAISRLVAQKFEIGRGLQRELVRRGQQVGCVRDDLPEDLLLALVFALDGTFDRWYFEHYDELSPAEHETFLQLALDLSRRILEPPASARGRLARVGRLQPPRKKPHAR